MCPMWLKNVAQKNPEVEILSLPGTKKPEQNARVLISFFYFRRTFFLIKKYQPR